MSKLALAFAAVLLIAATSHARTIHFVTDMEKDGGFLIEVTKAAFARVGHEVDIVYLPWARALNMTMNGQAEALLGVYYNEERARKMRYSDVVGHSDMVFFVLKNRGITYGNLNDLKPYTVGTIIGASYTPEFEAANFIRKDPTSDVTTNIRKLLAGRIDVFVEKNQVVWSTLKAQFPAEAGKIESLPVALRENRYFNAFSMSFPGYEQNVTDFNAGLKLIMQDGTYDKILSMGLHE